MRVVLCFLFNLFLLSFGAPSGFTVEQLHDVARVGAPAVNTRGDVAFSFRTWDTKKVTNSLVLYQADGTRIVLSNLTGVSESSATFSPTYPGLVASLSSRTGSSQVFIHSAGQESYQLTRYPIDVDNVRWFSGGLLLTMSVYPDCPDLQCTHDRDAAVDARGENTWKHYSQLFVRHWDQWETGKVSHIFVQKINIQGRVTLQGPAIDLLQGLNMNSPVPPFGGLEQIDISADGSTVAFTGQVVARDSAWTTGWGVYVVPASGQSVPSLLTPFTQARTQNPSFSPDGSKLAYLAMDRPGFEADRLHLNIYNFADGSTDLVTDEVDISFSGITWDSTSRYIIADADFFGSHPVFSIDTQSPKSPSMVVKLIDRATTADVVRVPNSNTFFCTRNSMQTPNNIWTFNFTASSTPSQVGFRQVTSENAFLSGITMSVPERFSFIGSLGDTVYGWVLRPSPGFDSSKKYPVVQLIHGGPQGNWGDDWSYRWNPQLWAGHGYVVYMIDFHGSTGYGQNFTDLISGNWGSYPYWDIMNGTNAVLQKYPFMDGSRVTACGASYGGFMINWIQGQTDFFKALVTHDGIFDTTQGYYATEELWFPEWEFKALPWEHPELYQRFNPAAFTANWKTPHLVIHGQHDYRLPLDHGLSAFTVLQRKGIPSEFLYFTQENHWVLNDNNGIKWYHTVLDWLDKWTK